MNFEVLKNKWDITKTLISQKPIVYCTGKCVGYNPGKPKESAIYCINNTGKWLPSKK